MSRAKRDIQADATITKTLQGEGFRRDYFSCGCMLRFREPWWFIGEAEGTESLDPCPDHEHLLERHERLERYPIPESDE